MDKIVERYNLIIAGLAYVANVLSGFVAFSRAMHDGELSPAAVKMDKGAQLLSQAVSVLADRDVAKLALTCMVKDVEEIRGEHDRAAAAPAESTGPVRMAN